MRRIGLFGGTFDPPHIGHLAIAARARDQLRLDRVVFMPAGTPPHKRRRRLSPVATRLAMTRLAIRGLPGFTVSGFEARKRGPSFTVDTLRHLQRRHPGGELYLILGADSLDDLAHWHEPDEIRRLATLAVAPRPGAGSEKSRRGVIRLRQPRLAVSSSRVRALARRGRDLVKLVPPAVARYVERRRLYRSAR